MPNRPSSKRVLRLRRQSPEALAYTYELVLSVVRSLLDESRVCKCRPCKSLDFRGRATALVGSIIAGMESAGDRSNPHYIPALRLRSECQASTGWVACNGFAMPPIDVVYDRCVRTQPPFAMFKLPPLPKQGQAA